MLKTPSDVYVSFYLGKQFFSGGLCSPLKYATANTSTITNLKVCCGGARGEQFFFRASFMYLAQLIRT